MNAPKLIKIECGVVIGCHCCGNLCGMDSYGSAAPVDTMAQYFWPTFQPSKASSCWHVYCLKESDVVVENSMMASAGLHFGFYRNQSEVEVEQVIH